MKSGKGARKHEQAVPWQQEAGTAPGRWQSPEPTQPPAAPGPQPGSPSRKEPGVAGPRGKVLGKLVDVALG